MFFNLDDKARRLLMHDREEAARANSDALISSFREALPESSRGLSRQSLLKEGAANMSMEIAQIAEDWKSSPDNPNFRHHKPESRLYRRASMIPLVVGVTGVALGSAPVAIAAGGLAAAAYWKSMKAKQATNEAAPTLDGIVRAHEALGSDIDQAHDGEAALRVDEAVKHLPKEMGHDWFYRAIDPVDIGRLANRHPEEALEAVSKGHAIAKDRGLETEYLDALKVAQRVTDQPLMEAAGQSPADNVKQGENAFSASAFSTMMAEAGDALKAQEQDTPSQRQSGPGM